MTSDLLYQHARNDLGLREKPGPGSEPRIRRAIELAAPWLDEDDSVTAWCGCIRGLWGLETGTGVPAAHYRAANWLLWGTAVKPSEARKGDTVVLWRAGGNHVGLFDRYSEDGRTVFLLGGNQGNKVSVEGYDAARITGVRR